MRRPLPRWKAFLRGAIPFYEEPTGIHVRLLRDVDEPDAFVEVIEYDTDEDYATVSGGYRTTPR